MARIVIVEQLDDRGVSNRLARVIEEELPTGSEVVVVSREDELPLLGPPDLLVVPADYLDEDRAAAAVASTVDRIIVFEDDGRGVDGPVRDILATRNTDYLRVAGWSTGGVAHAILNIFEQLPSTPAEPIESDEPEEEEP